MYCSLLCVFGYFFLFYELTMLIRDHSFPTVTHLLLYTSDDPTSDSEDEEEEEESEEESEEGMH